MTTATLPAPTVAPSAPTAPPSAESVALERLVERHRREYDFYVDRAKADGVRDAKDLPAFPMKLVVFSMSEFVSAALELARYERDENGGIVVEVPGLNGALTQGETYEEARTNLIEVIEEGIAIDLQTGYPIPELPNVVMDSTTWQS